MRLLTLALLVIFRLYWFLHENESAIKKPKTTYKKRIIERVFGRIVAGYLVLNLLGFIIYPFHNIIINLIGLALVIFGFIEAIFARKILDSNWTDANEYQIKKDHELITKGIYKYVRHPIYGGILLMVPGVLLVAGSYTFIIAFFILLMVLESFARREEKLLTKHFGSKYKDYMKTTKKFIPFVY